VALGPLPGCELGVSYFLPRIVGLGVATELMYTGASSGLRGPRRSAWSNKVAADDAMEAAADEYLEPMLKTAPLGLRMTKKTLNTSCGLMTCWR